MSKTPISVLCEAFLLSLSLMSAGQLVGCGNQTTEQIRAETARLKQQTEADKLRFDQQRVGGQPATIKLTTLEGPTDELGDRIFIQSTAGKGLDQNLAEVESDRVQIQKLDTDQFESSFQTSALSSQKSILFNLGCSTEFVAKYSKSGDVVVTEEALVPSVFVSKNGNFILNAMTVLMCKSEKLQGHDVLVRANRIVLNGFNYRASEMAQPYVGTGIVLETNSLELLGSSRFVSIGSPQKFPSYVLSGLEIVAKKISGEGQLTLESSGSDVLP